MSAPARRSTGTTHAGESLERVTAALEKTVGEGRPAGDWLKFCCPVHETGPGHHPSLIVKHLADMGRTKVQCQAGCPDEQILDAVGLKISDLYDEPITRAVGGRRRAPIRSRPQQRPVSRAERAIAAAGLPLTKPAKDLGPQTGPAKTDATYAYRDPNGQLVGEVVRRHIPHEHGREKAFFQRRRNAQGRMEAGGFAPIPYRLPEVLAAISAGRTIYIPEGEKDVDAAWRSGVPATCNAAGAGKWKPEHAQWLKGARRVVIIADRDVPGYRHAEKVAESLTGLVGEVRIVAAAAGKDLGDHFAAGHELGELEPVAGLDPRTPITSAPRLEAGAVPFAGEASVAVAAGVSPAHTPDGGSFMSGNSTINLSGLHSQEAGHHHDDTVDRVGSQFAVLIRAMMQEVMSRAVSSAQARREALKEQERREAKAQREHAAQVAAQRKAIETALEKMRKAGWDRLSRNEVASALQEAVSWSEDSDTARRAAVELAGHIRERWGVHVDLDGGHVTIDADMTPKLAAKMAAAEQERADKGRLATAQDRMVEMIAGEDIDESAKQQLYAQIEQWRNAPTPQGLSALQKKMKEAGVGESTRTKARFVALYLGGSSAATSKVNNLDTPGTAADDLRSQVRDLDSAATAAAALRRMESPMVDPGEEAKNRVDTLLMDYQTRLKHGHDTVGVQARLAEAISVMTEEDQAKARERGKEIRKNPAAERKPLWPDHVNRDDLAATVRAYAALAPVVESRVINPDGTDVDATWAQAQKDRATVMRAQIDRAIKSGKGLHDLERDQLRAVIVDIEAGKTAVPDLLLADDRSAAVIDRERSDEIAHDSARYHRHKLEEILRGGAAPEGVARHVREDISRVVAEHTQLAAGRTNLRDYEATGADERLLSALTAHGVPEPVRNQVRHHLTEARDNCASTGQQAHWIQDRWAGRREKVAVDRNPGPPAYDSPEYRALQEHNLRQAGLNEDEVRQCMAAEKGRAKPPSAAVNPPAPEQKVRLTTPGAGVQQTHHRGTDRDPGLGR
ncbi:hypothetical protein B7C42_07673 [Nocardia cerradoensis]|uniref:Toprim domain-containing protein n=1 Tax=Nocardia cerradoensis TaxID=85688 RepID=A0A231GUJ5_9NOCA|nr:hypothetical protein [Nocardia cerradoensis]OXR40248.1 hypothetical protein B7C42_07673 [Nocardia cerradoensis]